ncbi:hypothetical protein [Halorarius halobius]|uniref:hypothetical protein n=1 Tax=Halorarius halobius TaxID=2962671 RepID=UPI0020CE2A25|nr:hypothetical protein [Halorarius halobius]
MNRAVAVVTVVVLAGCSSVVGPAGTPTSTLTPAEVPDDDGAGPGGALAPGVTVDGVRDAATLADAHREALAATSHRFVRVRTISGPNATLNRVERNATVAANRSAYLFTKVETSSQAWPAADSYARIDIWYDGALVRNRFVDAAGLARHWGTNRSRDGGPVASPAGGDRAATVLSAVDVRVGNAGNGTYRLVATDLRDVEALRAPPLVDDPRNVSLTATVSARGVVRAYDLGYEASYLGRTVTVRERHRVTPLDGAAVPAPDWLAEANASMSRGGV